MKVPGSWTAFAILLVVVSAVAVYQQSAHQSDRIVQYPIERTLKYSFTVKNPHGHAVNDAELWIYSPIKESAFQHLATLTASLPYNKGYDAQGNERMEFVLDTLPPYAAKTISVTAKVNLSEQGNKIERIKSEAYLNDDKFVDLDSAEIQKVARRLKADTAKETVDGIYKWITKNITKSGYVMRDLGARYALKTKSGDCTEFMYLFSALARANGIPTRNLAGFVASENKVLRAADYHNWNEVYIDGEWYLVDADKQVFMEKSSEYIAMRLIVDATAGQSTDHQHFFSSSSEIQVLMN